MIDNKKISELYDTLAKELLIYIYSFVKSRENSEDILHDAFMRLISHSNNGSLTDKNLKSMMYTITRNLSIDFLRKKKHESNTELDDNIKSRETEPSENLRADELQHKIYNILETFDQVSRSVFLMKKELSLTYEDIAERLNISERTAKRKMKKTMEKIVSVLKNDNFLD